MACPTVWIFSASSSGIDSSNSSSNSMTSSTVSSESALRSLMKWVSRVISLLSTPICSLTISMTFCSMSSMCVPPTLQVATRAPGPTRPGESARLYRYPPSLQTAAGSHDHAPVDAQHLPRHVARVGAGQKGHHAGDLVGLAEALEWDVALGQILDLIVEHVGHIGRDEAGGDDVASHALPGQFFSHRL